MKATGLLARAVYTMVALPLGGAAGFYAGMQILPQFTASHPNLDPANDGSGIFNLALLLGTALALTAGLVALTLPWVRHRKRRGRGWRLAVSAVMVVVLSAAFAVQGYGWISDLAVVAWLTYTLAYTFVRYGIVDQAQRSSSVANRYY